MGSGQQMGGGASIFAGMGFIFATWVNTTQNGEWIYTDSPEWQVKNKEGVFRKWQWKRRLPKQRDQPQVSSSDETFDSRILRAQTVLLGKKTTIQNQGLHA